MSADFSISGSGCLPQPFLYGLCAFLMTDKTDVLAALMLIKTVRRITHPGEKDFYFFSSIHGSSSRIDYFFVPKANLNLITSCSIGNSLISDHSPIFLQLPHREGTPSTKMWRFNSSLLSDPNFISYFTSESKIFYTITNALDILPSTLWETSKAYSRGLIILYNIYKVNDGVPEGAGNPKTSYIKNPSESNLKTMLAAKASLNSLLTHNALQCIKSAKQKLYMNLATKKVNILLD